VPSAIIQGNQLINIKKHSNMCWRSPVVSRNWLVHRFWPGPDLIRVYSCQGNNQTRCQGGNQCLAFTAIECSMRTYVVPWNYYDTMPPPPFVQSSIFYPLLSSRIRRGLAPQHVLLPLLYLNVVLVFILSRLASRKVPFNNTHISSTTQSLHLNHPMLCQFQVAVLRE
jgi:hypothetical protein